ncbi:MAG: MYXO-CTERM sorting domain-containing protein [Myxococcales bacterium]|nr:MYXO-CTERM sorting domain-containing protein [Myxococcales bacterium]
MLAGNGDAPTQLAEIIGFNVFDEPFTVGPFDGSIKLDVELELFGVNYTSNDVELQTQMDGPVDATVVQEGEVVSLDLDHPAPGETTPAWGTVHGMVDVGATLRFIPTVEIQGLELAESLEVPFPLNEGVALAFAPEQMDFAGPPEPPEPETTGTPDPTAGPETDSDTGTDGDTLGTSTGDDSTTSTTEGPVDETTGDSAGASGTDGSEDEGCGCSADGDDRGAAGFALLGLALLGLRRRRR